MDARFVANQIVGEAVGVRRRLLLRAQGAAREAVLEAAPAPAVLRLQRVHGAHARLRRVEDHLGLVAAPVLVAAGSPVSSSAALNDLRAQGKDVKAAEW